MPAPLRLAIVGMSHGHVEGVLDAARRRPDLHIVGVWEPDQALFERLAARYDLTPELHFSDLDEMLTRIRPEAASIMTSIRGHLEAVGACARRGIPTLVEKPLAFSSADARAIADLAARHGVLVLTNFETSWYPSIRQAQTLIASGDLGQVRRLVFRHGHKGPRELGCAPEFLSWLTDPRENGGGAVVDFGCYGVALATWLMGGPPLTVVASRAHLKPETYPDVDDDAAIILNWPHATAVVQASWAWTHDNKEMDIHAERGSLHAGKRESLFRRAPDGPAQPVRPAPMPTALSDEWTYLRHVVRGECAVDPLSSLELNLMVADILDQARRVPLTPAASPPSASAASP